MDVFDALYTLAASDGCEEELFGSCAPLAREAFRRSLVAEGFPIVWFEMPLLGEPRFDLHVALSRGMLHAAARFLPGAGNGYDRLFSWYESEEPGGGGLAFAYDIGEGRIDDPAVHVNVNNAPLSHMDRFFCLAADADAAACYTGFASRLPQDWRVWYAGVHPGRPGSPVRVDCFTGAKAKETYAADLSLLERDLRSCGFSAISPALRKLAMPILKSPYNLELQFDVMRDGAPGPTLGISAGFPYLSASTVRPLFEEGGQAGALLRAIEGLGLADARWRFIADTIFSRAIYTQGAPLALYCSPTFVKLRMRDGEPLDAKVYLQAGAAFLDSRD